MTHTSSRSIRGSWYGPKTHCRTQPDPKRVVKVRRECRRAAKAA